MCARILPDRKTLALVFVLMLHALLGACSDEDLPTTGGDGGTPDPFRTSALSAASGLSSAWLQERLVKLAADAMEGRDNLTPGGKLARDYLAAEMKALGLQPAGRDGYQQSFSAGVNLVGLLPGRDPTLAGELVVLGAHYDHLGRTDVKGSQCRSSTKYPGDTVCNGASDNAAGCAVVLAVVKALAASAAGTRRSLLVAFWDAEEDGLLGSKHFVNQDPTRPLASMAAMMNVDAVGAEIFPGVSSSFALGSEYAVGLRERVQQNSAALGFSTYPVSSFFVGSDKGGRSDHLPFREKGIPTLFFSSGVSPEYHTPGDELAVVKSQKLLLTARHVLLTTSDVASASARPAFVAKPQAHIDDAKALHALGQALLKDPSTMGITDPAQVAMLKFLVDRLQRYLDDPPDTTEEWEIYQGFLKSIIKLVFEYR